MDRAKAWATPTSHLRFYSSTLTQSVEHQARRLLGKGLGALLTGKEEVPNIIHRPLRPYTGSPPPSDNESMCS